MPELPEVESVRLELEKSVLNNEIVSVDLNYPALLDTDSLKLSQMKGGCFTVIRRHGKYLEFVGDSWVLVAHLGMSGVFLCNKERVKHTHLIINFKDGSWLHYNDPRKFGYLSLVPKEMCSKRLSKLGPDAISRSFTKRYLWNAMNASARDVKTLLLDQQCVAGIGNIYASEILFRSGVHPERKGNSVTQFEAELMVRFSKQILKKSIENRGTTFSDYRLTDGKDGAFQTFLKVFQKEGLPCPQCSKPITRIRQGGRSTFFCGSCQH